MKQLVETVDKLADEIGLTGALTEERLRSRAKTIACVGLDHFKDELLDRCLDISKAIVAFSEELINPGGGVNPQVGGRSE